MKKLFVVLILIAPLALQFCSSSKNATKTKTKVAKISYASNVQALIAANCTPCHVGTGARSGHLDTYADAKAKIDEIIARTHKNPTDKGFMPFKHTKLSDADLNVFVQWKNDGLIDN